MTSMKYKVVSVAVVMVVAVVLAIVSGAGPATAPASSEKVPATQLVAKVPVNTVCPVSGEEVDKTVTTEYKGKTIGFCCSDCIGKFEKDPEKYVAKLK